MFGKKQISGRNVRKGEAVCLEDTEGFGFLILANGYRKAARYDEALEVCRAGLERRPDYLSARVALALILLERGDRYEAQFELEIILQASPTNLMARRMLANLYREDKKLEEAKQQFEEILWLVPGNAEALDALAFLEEALAETGMGRKWDPVSSVGTLHPEIEYTKDAEDSAPFEDEQEDRPEEAAEDLVEDPTERPDFLSSAEEESDQEDEEAVPDNEEPALATELLELEEEDGMDDIYPETSSALEDIAGDRETSPTELKAESVDVGGPAEVPLDLAEVVPEEAPFPGNLENLLVAEAESPPEGLSPPLENKLEFPEADWLTDLDDIASDADEVPETLTADPVDDPLGTIKPEVLHSAPDLFEETSLKGVESSEEKSLHSSDPAMNISSPLLDTRQEATIERLERLLDRIRSRSKGDEDS